MAKAKKPPILQKLNPIRASLTKDLNCNSERITKLTEFLTVEDSLQLAAGNLQTTELLSLQRSRCFDRNAKIRLAGQRLCIEIFWHHRQGIKKIDQMAGINYSSLRPSRLQLKERWLNSTITSEFVKSVDSPPRPHDSKCSAGTVAARRFYNQTSSSCFDKAKKLQLFPENCDICRVTHYGSSLNFSASPLKIPIQPVG